MELFPQVQHHINDIPTADQLQPTGMHAGQAPSSPTLPNGMVTSSSLPNMLNNSAETNTVAVFPNNITSLAPAIPPVDPTKIPETLQPPPFSTPEVVMETH